MILLEEEGKRKASGPFDGQAWEGESKPDTNEKEISS